MKKRILILLALFASTFLFATNYEVAFVVGNVVYESTSGTWEDVEVGQTLDSSTRVKTGINSSLKLKLDSGKTVTVRSLQDATIGQLILKGTGSIKMKKIKRSTIAAGDTKSKKGVSTAASRASEVKDDISWDEGENE